MNQESLVQNIQDKQGIILNEKSPKKEVDKANIQLEKLMAEYDKLEELKKEAVCSPPSPATKEKIKRKKKNKKKNKKQRMKK